MIEWYRPIAAAVVAIACAVASSASTNEQGSVTLAVPDIDVIHYDARVQPDLAARTIHGSVAISFVARGQRRDWVEFDKGDLAVDSVGERGTPQVFSQHDHHVRIQLSRPAGVGELRTVDIVYHGAPRTRARTSASR